MPSPDHHIGLSFWVQIDQIEVAGFAECSGLTIETEVTEYAEGGQNTYTHKLQGHTKYGNVTLKRGLDPGQDLHRWYVDSVDGIPNHRRNISIIIYSPAGAEVERWDLQSAHPVKWTGPDLKADAAATAIETLEFAHNGLVIRPPTSSPSRTFDAGSATAPQVVVTPRGGPTSGSFATPAQRTDHFARHGTDFGATSEADYESQADQFLNGPLPPGTLQKRRANGDVIRFNPATEEFGVATASGVIRTYYKPDPAVHGKASNLDYYNSQ